MFFFGTSIADTYTISFRSTRAHFASISTIAAQSRRPIVPNIARIAKLPRYTVRSNLSRRSLHSFTVTYRLVADLQVHTNKGKH